ncbi:MAG: pilus assembly FimT family protein [Pirellulaceae bacterium]
MHTAPAGPSRVDRHGFTLLELIIVLAILSVLIAAAWPALRRPVLRSAAQQAARQLVKDLARARMKAVESGSVMRFRFEPGGMQYKVESAIVSMDTQDTTGNVREENDASADAAASDDPSTFGFEAQLPAEVVFRDPSSVDDEDLPPGSALARMLEQESQETEEVTPLIDRGEIDAEFSMPVFFYPTGRAENAEFVLQGPDGYRISVRLRGLTGAASLGPLEHAPREGAAREDSGERPQRPAPSEDLVEPDFADK